MGTSLAKATGSVAAQPEDRGPGWIHRLVQEVIKSWDADNWSQSKHFDPSWHGMTSIAIFIPAVDLIHDSDEYLKQKYIRPVVFCLMTQSYPGEVSTIVRYAIDKEGVILSLFCQPHMRGRPDGYNKHGAFDWKTSFHASL